ncbi:hypothetical protein Ciccas_000891 [Cichlidogyrus casuarinus]|uniref:Uncharacterized protein n=1 Tax=Cichlidogyrus casuarinus TaxID=1844966 RepID=A0ABD2QNW8_9PLAT
MKDGGLQLAVINVYDDEIPQPVGSQSTFSNKTNSAILALIFVLIKDNEEHGRLFLNEGGVEKLNFFLTKEDKISSNARNSLFDQKEKNRRFAQFILRHLWKMKSLKEDFHRLNLHSEHFGPQKTIVPISNAVNNSVKHGIDSFREALVPVMRKLRQHSAKSWNPSRLRARSAVRIASISSLAVFENLQQCSSHQ